MKETILKTFAEVFGDAEGAKAYFAPGRVNLIGEHTDYNGGHVFPCALTIGTYGVARKRNDNKLRFYSMNFGHLGVIESSLEDLVPSKEAGWTNYPKGARAIRRSILGVDRCQFAFPMDFKWLISTGV